MTHDDYWQPRVITWLGNGLPILSIVLMVCLALTAAHSSQAVADKDLPAFMALSWRRARNINLPESKITIFDLPGSIVVMAAEATTAGKLLGLGNIGNTEALAFDPTTDTAVTFNYVPAGFISNEDWASMKPDSILRESRQATEAENIRRRLTGESEVHVKDWIQKPQLYPQSHTVVWAVGADDAGHSIANITVLKFGRYGFERVTFGSRIENVVHSDLKLDGILNALEFEKGARYSDYVPGLDWKANGGKADIANHTTLVRAISGIALGMIYPVFLAATMTGIGWALSRFATLSMSTWRMNRKNKTKL